MNTMCAASYVSQQLRPSAVDMARISEDCRGLQSLHNVQVMCTKTWINVDKVKEEGTVLKQVLT